jgi:hypothetical protein
VAAASSESSFSEKKAEILVSVDGTFTWQSKSRKKVTVYVATPDGSLESIRVRIR